MKMLCIIFISSLNAKIIFKHTQKTAVVESDQTHKLLLEWLNFIASIFTRYLSLFHNNACIS